MQKMEVEEHTPTPAVYRGKNYPLEPPKEGKGTLNPKASQDITESQASIENKFKSSPSPWVVSNWKEMMGSNKLYLKKV